MTTCRNTTIPPSTRSGANRSRTLPVATVAALVAVLALLGACTGRDVSRVEPGGSISADETAATPVEDPSQRDHVGAMAPELLVARAFCAAHHDVAAPGGVERVLSLMSDDVVVVDAVAGTQIEGRAAVREGLGSAGPDGVDSMECGATVRAGSWVALAVTARSSATGVAQRGVTAVRVVGGRVDEQVNHVTLEPDAQVPVPLRPVEGHRAVAYCAAWDHGGDPDAIMSFLAPGASLETVVTVLGRERIGEYAESDFPYDRNDCDDEVIEHGDWAAGASTLRMTDAGVAVDALSVVLLDEGGQVERHLLYPDLAGR